MLTFVGLGLYDERSITVEGKEAIEAADHVFAEFYTSQLAGTSMDRLQYYLGAEISVLQRDTVERDPTPILDPAETGEEVVFATAGDPMIATTHVDLRLRAHERGVSTRIVHGTTAQAAAASLTGLQNYRFGKATTLPFEEVHGGDGVPASVLETIRANRERGLHTLVFLDIKVEDEDRPGEDAFMTGPDAAALLAEPLDDPLAVLVARAGSATPKVLADRCSVLADHDVGRPLHLLVIPGECHEIEQEALVELADAPADAL